MPKTCSGENTVFLINGARITVRLHASQKKKKKKKQKKKQKT